MKEPEAGLREARAKTAGHGERLFENDRSGRHDLLGLDQWL
ncbi:hypothetical protein [Paractinoplanes atraurantiacus]|nr:hypothetical protein [Actinoplanes atraurantiacus]